MNDFRKLFRLLWGYFLLMIWLFCFIGVIRLWPVVFDYKSPGVEELKFTTGVVESGSKKYNLGWDRISGNYYICGLGQSSRCNVCYFKEGCKENRYLNDLIGQVAVVGWVFGKGGGRIVFYLSVNGKELFSFKDAIRTYRKELDESKQWFVIYVVVLVAQLSCFFVGFYIKTRK